MDFPCIEESYFLQNTSGENFSVLCIMPHGNPIAILQVLHGMAEHSGRYREFGFFLAKHGFGLVAADHPGHGKTAPDTEALGVLSPNNGWEIMLSNAQLLYTHIRTKYSYAPVYMLGHSMGSMLAQHLTAYYPVYIQGLMLSGSFQVSAMRVELLKAFLKLQGLFLGFKTKSRWFNKLFNHSFNRHFKKNNTGFDWISSSSEEVLKYMNDPFCGFNCSIGFFYNLSRGIKSTKKAGKRIKYRKTLPLLIFGGQEDPVGNFGKDAMAMHREFYKQRFQNLSVKIFHGRHEMLHEKNKYKVYEYLLNWMLEQINTR